MNPPHEQEGWHLDRRVPLAMMVALLVQTAGIVWWAATIDGRTASNSGRLDKVESTQRERAVQESRLAVLEFQIGSIQTSTRELAADMSAMRSLMERAFGRRGQGDDGRP